MVLPSHATVPTHHLGLMFGFIGAHTTQSPPRYRYSGHTLHRGEAVAQGPERGAFYLGAGLKYGLGWIPIGGLFCIRIQRIQSSQTAKRASAFGHTFKMSDSHREVTRRRRGKGSDKYKTPPRKKHRQASEQSPPSPLEAALGTFYRV